MVSISYPSAIVSLEPDMMMISLNIGMPYPMWPVKYLSYRFDRWPCIVQCPNEGGCKLAHMYKLQAKMMTNDITISRMNHIKPPSHQFGVVDSPGLIFSKFHKHLTKCIYWQPQTGHIVWKMYLLTITYLILVILMVNLFLNTF